MVFIPIFIGFFCRNPGLFLTICSELSKIHTEYLKKSNFPSKFIDRCIKLFFDKTVSAKKKAVPTVPMKVVNISLPFLGKPFLKIRGNLIKLAKTYFPCCKIQVVFNSGKRLIYVYMYINVYKCI